MTSSTKAFRKSIQVKIVENENNEEKSSKENVEYIDTIVPQFDSDDDHDLYFKLQGDGNLVVKRKLALNKTIAWTSKTNVDDEVKFSLSNQGIATITDETGKELWSKLASSKPDRNETCNKCGFDLLLCKDRELEVNTDYKAGDFICSPD